MNTHGINRAAINSSVSRIVTGAALIAVASSVMADGIRTQFSSATIAGSSTLYADGVRQVNGAATVAVASSGSAQWVIATSASAAITVKSALMATYTEAYQSVALAFSGTGTVIRPGGGVASVSSSGAAVPTVTAFYAGNIGVSSSFTADASVQRSGQSTWQRDGYAGISVSSSMNATGLRTASGTAMASVTSDATATGLKTHGGAAFIDCQSSMQGLGSIENASIFVTSSFQATGTVYQFAGASFALASSLSGVATNTRQGQADTIRVTSSLQGDGRLALRGESAFTVDSDMTAEARLALQGAATIASSCALSGDPVIVRFGGAEFDVGSALAAEWIVLKFGAANIVVTSQLDATPSTNPTVPAPPERTVLVPYDERTMVVPAENRTMEVQ